MSLLLTILNVIMSLNFIQIKHPLAMGLTLLIQTIIISLTCGLYTYSYWFAYILFLIMLGGMLVLFIYVTSLASNELFSFSILNFTLSILLLSITLVIILFMDKTILLLNNIEMMKFNMNNLFSENELSLNKLYNNPTMNITLMMMNYLLLTLIVIVKIVNINYGPLRQKF
uniref:NADH-ubiquinone oxidoreductase chain 6 n=2 Tax=Nepsalus TaxID=2029030 RepID=A0AAU6QFS5_9NEOP|nr:NADH dehydrogenase subunit 6 [Nepsalus decorillus]ATI25227.1 NADH dehydrogenase subunit 6 [Nepsalus jezoensis]URT60565.1 NADH dehydrogenase subunit 6 [Nepsalus decorillus]URT60578.1 NADH dehydrogenase subunit 6 [Nepsalus decorillus]URT60604.1 NADH dehydrogenase subunit 6 [Nepsalus decorillus]URT60617.1 NADH dehydrogenase subunit 6 [Nepsalus decorillus]